MITRIAALAVLAFFACQSDPPPEAVDFRQELPGTWETTEITAALHTAEGTDTTITQVITPDIWRDRFGAHPVRYTFQADNKFTREHRMLTDTLANAARGLWNIFGDTLVLIEPDGTYQYLLSKENDQLIFRTQVDWDGDGAADDDFVSVQRLVEERGGRREE